MYKIIETQGYLDGDRNKHIYNHLYRVKNNIATLITVLKPDYDGHITRNYISFEIDGVWLNNETRVSKDITNKIKCIKSSKNGFNAYRIMYKDIQLGFNVSDINYSEKKAIEMWINKGYLFRGI